MLASFGVQGVSVELRRYRIAGHLDPVLACSIALELDDPDGALDALQPYFEKVESRIYIRHLEADPDFNAIRDHPRFVKMLAAAKVRLGMLMG